MKSTMGTSFRAMNAEIARIQRGLEDLQKQAASGKKLNDPSDNPAAIRPVLTARGQIRASDRYIETMDRAMDEMKSMDTKMAHVENLMVQSKEQATYAINGSLGEDGLANLADQVSLFRDELRDSANFQVEGKHIFAGYKENTEPFVEDSSQFNGISAQGDIHNTTLEISPGERPPVDVNGRELFLGQTKSDKTDAEGNAILEQTGTDMFATLRKVELAMRGHEEKVVDETGTAIADAAYKDGNPETGIPRLVDGSNSPVTNASGDQIELTHNGEPVHLKQAVNEHGEALTLKDVKEHLTAYEFGSGEIDVDNVTDLSKPAYMHKDGSFAVVDKQGDPILMDGSGSPVEADYDGNGTNDSYVNLRDLQNTGTNGKPLKQEYIPKLTTQLDSLEDAADQERRLRGLLGNHHVRVENAQTTREETKVDLEEMLSRYEDADLVEVLTDLKQQQTALEAALNVTSKVASLSILNFM